MALADTMKAGYTAHFYDFPSVVKPALNHAINACKTARDARSEAAAAAQLATESKDNALQSLLSLMKSCLKKSQVDVANDPQKLSLIGWGPKLSPQPADAAGQPCNLRAVTQGQGTLLLAWERPSGGGPVRNYIIERRQQSAGGEIGEWFVVSTSLSHEINLTEQPRGIQLEYRIKAVNTGGESPPSNTISAVL